MRRTGHLSRWLAPLLVIGYAAAGVVAAPNVAAAVLSQGLDEGGEAVAAATRGERTATRPIPPPPGCDRVIVIGDSLTVGSRSALRIGLADVGFDAFVDGYSSRRIPESAPYPFSGVKAAVEVRATFGEADCWVIALGTNDLNFGAYQPAVANAYFDEMLAEVTPGADVWWVNINFRDRASTSYDERERAAVFNGELDARADANPEFEVIDWYTYSEAHTWWFVDAVHVNAAGYFARATQIVEALPVSP